MGNEEEPDEEELKERRRAARRTSNQKSKSTKQPKTKRAAKKPKVTNGVATELALRPALNGDRPTTKSKKRRVRPSGFANEEGLYGMIPVFTPCSLSRTLLTWRI